MNAAKPIFLAFSLLCAGNAFAQEVEKEPAAIVELGVTDWSITEGGSSFGPTIAVEVTPIENWLELEAGVTPLFRTAIANHLEPLQYLRAACRPIALLPLLVVCSTLTGAQEVKFVDLSSIQQRTQLRVPPTQQPNCVPEPCVVERGSLSDGAPLRQDPRGLGIALDRVTPTDISLDAFEVDFRVLNTGLVPIEVPVSPHLSDLQPPGEPREFQYLNLALLVRLTSTGPMHALGVGWVEMYGSADRRETIVSLKPGQWVRVDAKVKLHTWPSHPSEAQLRGDFWLRNKTFKPGDKGGYVEAVDVYPNRTLLPAIAVHFSPTRSASQQP